MVTKLQTIIEAAQELSPLEQLNLINALSQSLYRSYQQVQSASDFWTPQTVAQLAETQQTKPIAELVSLGAKFWPEDEKADDIIEYIYRQRQEDLLRES